MSEKIYKLTEKRINELAAICQEIPTKYGAPLLNIINQIIVIDNKDEVKEDAANK